MDGEIQGSNREEVGKTTPLVGDVSEYGGFYGGLRRGGRPDKKEEVICFGYYDIRNGQTGGLQLDLSGMANYNIYLGILQEKNITGGVYTRLSVGFHVVEKDVPNHH